MSREAPGFESMKLADVDKLEKGDRELYELLHLEWRLADAGPTESSRSWHRKGDRWPKDDTA
jgi:hypothetical protein